ncbi:hypothetical protein [Geothrix sp. 21YS21S-4]|uniref:hypothetical protein n=1 Tax=Geothrix sp. 21YS21S-4 TaxID=3068889 RepID=UPI0027BAB434|nr:hypothetical protein [Geothrix sp. 21YS21S-4]
MFRPWFIGLILGASLTAAQPAPRTQAWVLALDGRGGVVGDLKPEEFQVKVEGKGRSVVQVKTPAQTAEAAQSWTLVFEPIRDTNLRAVAFVAAADFLTKVPEGDRVFIAARGKDSLESLMPGFSARRSVWAAALARVPDMLPESFVGSPKESLQGLGFNPSFADQPEGPEGQEALMALVAKFRSGAPGWAKGTNDLRGVNVLDRLNFNNPSYITGLLATIARESKALESVLDHLAPLPGQKHMVVFSRCEADDMSHPSVKRAMTQRFRRERGDAGGPAESATLATRDMTILQASLRAKAAEAGVTLFSVAGAGQNVLGHVGAVASATGGFSFPLNTGIETTFGQGIQVFGSRYLVAWSEDAAPQKAGSLEIATTRKDVKLVLQATR